MTTTSRPLAPEARPAPGPMRGMGTAEVTATKRHRVFATGLLVLAAGLVANTVLGPLGVDRIDYQLSRSVLNQLVGLEVVTIGLVVPLALAAVRLTWRGDPGGPALAFGPTAYTAYMFAQYVLGPEYATYGWAVLGHLALFALGGVLAVESLISMGRAEVPELTRRRSRWTSGAVFGMAAFVIVRYLPLLPGAADGSAIPAEFEAARTFYWSIVLLDLGVVVPGALTAGFLLLRRLPGASTATLAVIGWFALVPPSVAAMSVAMLLDDDPNASVGLTAMLCGVSVLFAVLAVWVFHPFMAVRRRS